MNSILNYPVRGTGGNNQYRGNCSPLLIHDLLDFYKYQQISDYMVGSGTTADVAKERKIVCSAYDLHSGFNLLTDDIRERNEFIFWHPPYHNMIQYADNMYSAEEVMKKYGYNPNEFDLSQCPSWEEFIKKLNYCLVKQYHSLEKGGRLAVLMGDLKKKGKCYSMLLDMARVGTLENILVKTQHHCMSSLKQYTNNNFIKIVHEYVLILRKDAGLFYELSLPKVYKQDIRDISKATWKDIVADVLEECPACTAPLFQIYGHLEGHARTKGHRFWKEKVRQTLQLYPEFFCREERGVWKLIKKVR